MPYRQYHNGLFAGIEDNPRFKVIQLHNKVLMCQHNTLGFSCRTGGKNDRSNFRIAAFFQLLFNRFGVCFSISHTPFDNLIIAVHCKAGSVALCFELFIVNIERIKHNERFEQRKLLLIFQNFYKLIPIFYDSSRTFGKGQNTYQILFGCITAARNIGCSDRHNPHAGMVPLFPVICDKADSVSPRDAEG